MSDEEMRKLDVPSLQDEGYIFLWVTGRSVQSFYCFVTLLKKKLDKFSLNFIITNFYCGSLVTSGSFLLRFAKIF